MTTRLEKRLNIYDEIAANKRRSFILIVLFIVLISALVEVFSLALGGGYEVGVIAFVFSFLFALFSYYSSASVALAVSQAKEIKKEDAPELYNIVENLCIGSGLPMPKLYIIDDTAPNAFATGRDPQHASVAVTKGLLQKMDKLELEGVLAHELSHVRNYDIRVMTIVVVLVGFVALLADIFLKFTWFGGMSRSGRRGGGGGGGAIIILALALVMAILAPIAAQLIQLAISRRREYLADASGALLTRYPDGLARALEKIDADREPLEVANKATAHLYIANPLKDRKGAFDNLFSTHPPIKERIRRLRAM